MSRSHPPSAFTRSLTARPSRTPSLTARPSLTASLALPLALAMAATAAAAGAAADAPRTGAYHCEAGRAAGIQGRDERYAGRIELPAAEQRFAAGIRRLPATRPGCRGASPSRAERAAGHEAWWRCGAAFELELPGSKYPEPLRSDDGYIFRDRLSGWFHLADDLRYVFAYTDFAGNYFVEEGACQRD